MPGAADNPAAVAFMAFLKGPEARAIIEKYGYAFAVGPDTWHSVDPVGPEVSTRDSILLTYFVDSSPLTVFRNRSRRLGNFIGNEIRNLDGWRSSPP